MRQQLRKVIDDFFVNMTIVDLRMHTEEDKYNKLTSTDLMYLHIIEVRSGEYTVTKLAELLGISKPSVTNKINELEKKGYVTKQRDAIDKRIQYLCINEVAINKETFYKKYEELDVEVVDQITQKYTEKEIMLFIKMLHDVGENYFSKIVK